MSRVMELIRAGLRDRCVEPPLVSETREIGSYPGPLAYLPAGGLR